MASAGMARVQDENKGEPMLTSPGGKASRKRKMEERDENSLGEPEDFAWENSKENVMPLKRGRVVDDLNRALRAQESFHGRARVEQEAKEMEARVHDYEGSDPLSMWVQYVKWLEANMPEDTRKKFTALEKCTRALKNHAEYKDDIRYIRLWIQYADLVSNPKDIFKFLYVNKIGEHVALFYVGWAMVLESVANYAQAHKVYLKATQKKAQPEALLDRKYKEFQRRMSRHWLKVSTSEGNDSSVDGNQRFALGDISTDGADIQRLGNSDNFRRYAQSQAEKMQRANAHKPVFTVYEDPAGTEVDLLDTGADWKRLDTMEHQNKENDMAPTRWNDAPLRRENPEVTPAVRAPAHPPAEDIQRLDGASTEEEKLLKQPLKNFTAEAKPETAKPPRATKSNRPTNERFVYNEDLLKSKSGEELCFEEVRARQFATKDSKSRASCSFGSGNRFLAEQPANVATSHQSAALKPQQKASSGRKTAVDVPKLREQKCMQTAEPVATLNRAAQDDMTINTRLAVEDINSMFCSPSRESNELIENATVWEVPEPVERKLHFSIFDDSVDSVAVNPNDISLRNENAEQAAKNSFQVFTEDPPTPQPFQVFSDEADAKLIPAPRTASKMSARKPLTAREDIVRRSRLTNKDMLLKIQTDGTAADGGESSKLRAIMKLFQRNSIQKPVMRKNEGSTVTTTRVPNAAQRMPQAPKASYTSFDPYAPAIRRQMIEFSEVKSFAASNPHLVHWHSSKAPSLWTANQQRRKLKKSVFFHLDEKVSVEAVGFLGSGAFAQVFSVKVEGVDPAPKTMALKCEKTANNLLWEIYITEKLRKCANGVSIPRMCRLDIFKNGTLLLMDKAPAGTLHDLLNAYKKDRRPFPETLAVHYAIQMLYTVESIHGANILHGDIKPDNWLMVPINNVGQDRKTSSRTGSLRLIDFGRSIDMDQFPAGTTFRGDCHVKGFQTIEMITEKPWTTQIDTFGVCATVHCMLFGDYMEVTKVHLPDGTSRWKPVQALKRYWHVAMWKSFFDTFLNVPSCDEQPCLAAVRRRFERYLEESPHRQEELHELLASQERMLIKPKV